MADPLILQNATIISCAKYNQKCYTSILKHGIITKFAAKSIENAISLFEMHGKGLT